MFIRLILLAITAVAYLPVAKAVTTCGVNDLCPQDSPCCSQYGECGTGAYCLGGCDPRYSFNIDSCTPQPICVSGNWTFADNSSLIENTVYLGDASKSAWVYSGYPLFSDGDLVVAMPNQSVGTVISSSTYIWYGKVSVTMKSSRGAGVVSAAM